MPVVLVCDTQPRTAARVRRMLEAANRAIARTLDLPRGTVWVRYDAGKTAHYWEGETGNVPPQGRPVLVFVHLVRGRDPAKLRKLFGELSSSVAGALGMLPEYVWIRIDEMDPERVGQGAHSMAELRGMK